MKNQFLVFLLLCLVSCQKDIEQFNLNIRSNPVEGGSVTSVTEGFNAGETVNLTAVAAAGYEFTNWSGDAQGTIPTITVQMNTDKSIVANFNLTSGLPIVNINTYGLPIASKEDYLAATITIEGGERFQNIDETAIQIRGRGNSTWWLGNEWGKKPYQIKFDTKTEVLGMPEDRKWVFLAELSDKSLIRNQISRDFGQMSSLDYTPKLEYVELYLNNLHQGTYLLGQKAEESSNRVNVGDSGYLIEIDQLGRIDADDVYFTSDAYMALSENSVFNIKHPNTEFNDEQYQLIDDHITYFESVLFSADFANPTTGYTALIDVDSFIDWYLINEIGKSVDAAWYSSIYFSYIPGEKIKMGPIWDFDLSYGNADYSEAQFEEGFWIRANPWIQRLFEDPEFAQKVAERYVYYYNNMGEILNKIDTYANRLNASQKNNYEIWPTLGVYVWPNPVFYDNYPDEVSQLKNWIMDRMNWLNSNY